MDQDRRKLLNRLVLGCLIGPSLAALGCGGSAESGRQAPKAGLDELEAQNQFYLERQKKEAAKK